MGGIPRILGGWLGGFYRPDLVELEFVFEVERAQVVQGAEEPFLIVEIHNPASCSCRGFLAVWARCCGWRTPSRAWIRTEPWGLVCSGTVIGAKESVWWDGSGSADGKVTVDGCSGDAKCFGDLGVAVSFGSSGMGGCEAGHGPSTNHVALEFGQCGPQCLKRAVNG